MRRIVQDGLNKAIAIEKNACIMYGTGQKNAGRLDDRKFVEILEWLSFVEEFNGDHTVIVWFSLRYYDLVFQILL